MAEVHAAGALKSRLPPRPPSLARGRCLRLREPSVLAALCPALPHLSWGTLLSVLFDPGPPRVRCFLRLCPYETLCRPLFYISRLHSLHVGGLLDCEIP